MKVHSFTHKLRKNKFTGEIVGFDVGLGTVDVKIGVFRADIDSLRVEADGELEVIVDESLFGLLLEIGRHVRRRCRKRTRSRENRRVWKRENWEGKDSDLSNLLRLKKKEN